MSDDQATRDIIDRMNRDSAAACGVEGEDNDIAAHDIGGAASATMLGIIDAWEEHGTAPVSTLGAFLQICIHMLRRTCPDGPLVPMLRSLADLEEARSNGVAPDPALQATLQQHAIAMTLSARRAREGGRGLQ